jgi:hypothetical protein
VELVSAVEHKLSVLKGEEKMGSKASEWRVEIQQDEDLLHWTLFSVNKGLWSPVYGNTSVTVSDMFLEAGRVLSPFMPEFLK